MRPWSCSVLRAVCATALLSLAGTHLSGDSRFDPAGLPAVLKDPRGRIEFLRGEIARHDELYHRRAQPEISDADYDALKAELMALEAGFPEVAATLGATPVREVGDDRLEGFPKHRHREPMLSLEKTTTEEGLREFDQRIRSSLGQGTNRSYVVEPKFDGLAISATYEDGRLTSVATRGNGEEGDDVTATALRVLCSLPRGLAPGSARKVPRLVEVRGEAYLSFAEFERINREREEAGEPGFANPRNLAAGTLKSLVSDSARSRVLDVVFYGLGAFEGLAQPESQRELLEQLAEWGLPAVDEAKSAATIEEAWHAVQEFGRRRGSLAYPIDGAVVKLDGFAGRAALGTGLAGPRWAIAFKFPPERVCTEVLAIAVQIGRTGVATPVAELAPVRLAGATITRATLHNAAALERRDIRVGDWVFIERQGDIIPAVTGVDVTRRVEAKPPFEFPSECPGCGERLQRTSAHAVRRCANLGCPARLVRRLRHFASEDGLAIRGLGDSAIEKLVRGGVVHDFPDLFRMSAEDLRRLGWSAESAERLLAAIADAKHPPLSRLLRAIGIPGVGKAGAAALAREFGTLEELLAADATALVRVPGIGSGSAEEIARFFADPASRQLLADLRLNGVSPTEADRFARALAGKVFVLTGSLPNLTRAEAITRIEAAGGEVAATVTRRTDFVVVGESPGGKLDRARRLGIRTLGESELLQLLADGQR